MRKIRRILPIFMALFIVLTSLHFHSNVFANETEEPLVQESQEQPSEVEQPLESDPLVETPNLVEITVEVSPDVEEQPVVEVVEELPGEEPVVEDPVVEEPVTEDPAIDDQVVEDPMVEKQPVISLAQLPEMTEIIGMRVNKVWSGNFTGLEPVPSATIELYNVDTGEVLRTQKVTYGGETEFIFGNLPYRNADESVAEYSIREVDVPEYIKVSGPTIAPARIDSVEIIETQSELDWRINKPRILIARLNPSTDTHVIWTLNRVADEERSGFVDALLAAAGDLASSNPFRELNKTNIVWLYGPHLSYTDPGGNVFGVNIVLDPETGMAVDGEFTFSKESMWTHFATANTISKTATITNTYIAPIEWTPAFTKVFEAGDRELVAGEFTFTLTDPDGDTYTATNDAEGRVVFDAFEFNYADVGKTFEYKVVEVKGTETNVVYDATEITINVAITFDEVNNVLVATPTYSAVNFRNKYEVPLIDVTAKKVWNGGPSEDHTAVTLVLERSLDNETWEVVEAEYEITGEAPEFTYTWVDLAKTDYYGKEYLYRVLEPTVPENYEAVVEGMTITNTYTSPLIDITANKVWVDGPEEKPTVTFQLYRNGEPYGDPVELVDGQPEVVWEDLDLTDFNGVDYVYTVKEVGEVENYTKVEEGLTVTNTYVSPKIDIEVEKIWVDGPEEKPEITINLLRNGEEIDSVTLADGETKHTFKDLDKTNRKGVDYVYTIEEITVDGYESVVEDYSITNTYIIEKVNYIVEKIWVNGPEIKPVITIQLYRNGVAYGLPVELRHGSTTYIFKDLDKTDKNGVPYKYTVDELDVEGYEKKVEGFVITNTFIIEKIDIEVEKVWVNAPTTKPTIEIQLYRDGEAYLEPVKLEDGTTKYTYKDLDKTDEKGKEYIYTIKELTELEKVTVTVEDFVITNTYQKDPPKLPKTGEEMDKFRLLADGLIVAGAYFILRKKVEEQ